MLCAFKGRQLGLLASYSRPWLVSGHTAQISCRNHATAVKQKASARLTASTKAPAKPSPRAQSKTLKPAASPSDATSSTKKPSSEAPSPKKTGTGATYVIKENKDLQMSEEEQLAQVDQILSMARLFPTADPWGQRVETLAGPRAWKNYPTWGAVKDQFMQNRFNAAKNATSMLLLAQANAFPGVDLSESKFYHRYFTQWPWRAFTVNSLSPKAWNATLRQIALETYRDLNTAVARHDDKTVKRLTTAGHQDSVLRTMRKASPQLTYIWRLHKEVTPTRIVSIRGTEGYLGTDEPKFGNRMMVHALVKFDTEQSLEIYDQRGKPLHTPASDSGKTTSGLVGTVPAERRRVTEYLVMEKRMWYDGPWTFREQLWETPGMTSAV
ncbi:hypothetical protein BDN72DRAFT_879375 [Pluteus cervinus]|uniref:Uncharacterized protein n=1 Tax=Pluteus cervinus TaxID=181527 RepID=A0ACD3ASH3_9AGAR|nr:hypothetical protein BDN72DRAFT_879375 [Pluteus cervinus]